MAAQRRSRRPTLHDVAKIAGVDASTVSVAQYFDDKGLAKPGLF